MGVFFSLFYAPLHSHNAFVILNYANGPNIAEIDCCEPLICGKKWARSSIKITRISTGTFRAKFDIDPKTLTFQKPNSIKLLFKLRTLIFI